MKQTFLNRMRTLATSKFAVATAVALLLMLFLPSKARGQFGLDPCCAIISAGLNSISGLLKSVVAAPLKAILDIQQQEATFEQQVVYPAESISNALGLAGQFGTEASATSRRPDGSSKMRASVRPGGSASAS